MESTGQGNSHPASPSVNIPTASSSSLATIGSPSEPELGIMERRTVTLRLVVADSDANCDFWVGLAKRGELSPSSLLDQTNITAVFEEAAIKGVSDDGPIMLSDSSSSPARFVYLVQVPAADFRDRTAWVTNLVNMIRSWAPRTAGFYMAPELIVANDSQELLQQVLRELILTTPATDFYLLVGTHGLNAVLNTSLKLKLELESETLNLLVFH